MAKDVAGRFHVQNEGLGKVKYVEIAKNKRSQRKAQVGHNKIQKKMWKKITLIPIGDVYKAE